MCCSHSNTLRLFLLTALAGWAALACGKPQYTEASEVPVARDLDLLRVQVHSSIEELGLVEPDPVKQWGTAGVGSWAEYTGMMPDGRPFVWSLASKVGLNLNAGKPVDRQLELTMWCVPAADGSQEALPVEVLLNGISVASFELSARPKTYATLVHAPAWHEGRNLLELRISKLRRAASGELLGVALKSVRYGQERRIHNDPDTGLLELSAGTAVRYSLDFPASIQALDTRLYLKAKASGEGSLELSWERRDLLTAALTPVGSAGRISARELAAGLEAPVPDPQGGQLRVSLGWESEQSGNGLHFEQLLLRQGAIAAPPVLLISIDTFAAERMSLYGYERQTTPHLDQFAAECVVFEQCSSNAPWTLPSFMSLMTGLYPGAHLLKSTLPPGERRQLWDEWQLAESRLTLAEAFRARGYRTAAFVDNLWLTERFHFTQGFEVYDASAGRIPLTEPTGGIEQVTRLGFDWLSQRRAQDPFLLFLHAFDLHGPYLPPGPWKGHFAAEPLPEPVRELPANGLQNVFGVVPDYISEPYLPAQPGPDPTLSTTILSSAYDEGVLAMDERLAAFLERLRSAGILDRCILVITADHGETSQGHGYFYGHGVLFQDVLHVPLLVRLPGGKSGGLRIPDPVQLVDLYPTLIDLIGGRAFDAGFHGRSLEPLLARGTLPPEVIYSEAGVMSQHSVRLGQWKLVRMEPGVDTSTEFMLAWPGLDRAWLEANAPELLAGGLSAAKFSVISARLGGVEALRSALREQLASKAQTRLFDLDVDPDELVDVAPAHPAVVEQLESLLNAQIERVKLARGYAQPNNAPPAFTEAELTELGKIGYAESK